jgi:hypothetical protein
MIQVRNYADFKSMVPTTTLFIFYYVDVENNICFLWGYNTGCASWFVTANLNVLPATFLADYASHGAPVALSAPLNVTGMTLGGRTR